MLDPAERRAILLKGAKPDSKILEIGASYNPTAPKRDGANRFTVDYTGREELVAKYTSPGFDTSVIEEVDFIWNNGDLIDSIPADHHNSFDFIVASQVIEHIPNPIRFLKSLERLLAPNGTISLSIPDKRRCFDFFRPLTSTGDWLQAFLDSRAVHDAKTLYDQAAYIIGTGDDGSVISWGPDKLNGVHFRPGGGVLPGMFLFQQMKDSSFREKYVDCHAWVFVPSSFRLIVEELYAGSVLDCFPHEAAGSSTYEFFLLLKCGRSAKPIDDRHRMRLLVDIAKEVNEGFLMICPSESVA